MNTEEMRATCDILRYIQKQPQAKHTAEGIAKYWIFQQRLEENLEIVLAAIAYLIEKGFLEEIHLPDSNYYFHVNQEKLSEIPQAIQALNQGAVY